MANAEAQRNSQSKRIAAAIRWRLARGRRAIRESTSKIIAAGGGFWRERQRTKHAKAQFAKHDLLHLDDRADYVACTQRYWLKHYGQSINPLWHVAIAAVTGVRDERFIPHNIWLEKIVPHFNSARKRHAYLDKNLARALIHPRLEVPSLIKRIHGAYYTDEYSPLSSHDAARVLAAHDGDVIIKGTTTDDGHGVRLARISDGVIWINDKATMLPDLERLYGPDFTVQERVTQHPAMAAPHPNSVNTVRVLTFRWRGEIHLLLAFVRMGVDGRITDNAGTGGICRGVEADGSLSATGVDAYGKVYRAHPSSGFAFTSEQRVPGYERLRDYARELHERVYHFDLVSWDFVIGADEQPIFLEMNFRGASYVYQFACAKPIFGDLTPEVFAEVRKDLQTFNW
ncbi:MAG TPA: sugar-transfer associated ATP-grasp domain-containing protein [Rhodocyclaceae bacterium]|nr:sugar-transfer associated ATP-grasp domain-containing protein [Rhodocyclaceae bacterium]